MNVIANQAPIADETAARANKSVADHVALLCVAAVVNMPISAAKSSSAASNRQLALTITAEGAALNPIATTIRR